MSPITGLALQRRAVETGRIRIGQKVVGSNGKSRPSKLDRFRFTTSSERVARAIAAHLGGDAEPWTDAPTPGQWQVLTPSTEINVAIPPGDNAVSQWMELWSGGGCVRRCTGERETLKDTPCLCPLEPAARLRAAQNGQACKPTTRISVIIPDLPGIGVFRLESHGWNAAAELAGTAELLAAARGAGVIVPAVLRLEQRQSKKDGQTRNFAVPVLEVLPTLRDLTALQSGSAGLAAALPPPTGQQPAIAAAAPAAQRAVAPAPAPRPGEGGAPTDAADVAARALVATDRDLLARLGRFARDQRWMDTHVEHDGAWEPLVDVLRHRDEQLRAGPPPPSPPADPPADVLEQEPPEDDPTVSGAPREAPPFDPADVAVDW